MDDQLAEKFAGLFAECAVTGDVDALREKTAAINPLLAAGLGATVGGGIGYLGTSKKKNKLRNAIYGALTGGLGTGGLALAHNSWNGSPVTGAGADAAADKPGTPKIVKGPDGKLVDAKPEYSDPQRDLGPDNPHNDISKVRPAVSAAGALGGATLAGSGMDATNKGQRAFGGRSGRGGELDRLADGTLADKVKGLLGAKKQPYSAIQTFLTQTREGRMPFLRPSNLPRPGTHASLPKPQLDTFLRDALKQLNDVKNRAEIAYGPAPTIQTKPIPPAPVAPPPPPAPTDPLGQMFQNPAVDAQYQKALDAHSKEVERYEKNVLERNRADRAAVNDANAAARKQFDAAVARRTAEIRARLADREARRSLASVAPTGSLGETPEVRARNQKLLEQHVLGGKEIRKGDLANAKGFRFMEPGNPLAFRDGGRFQTGRAVRRGVGGLFGGVAAELLIRALQHRIANGSLQAAPAEAGISIVTPEDTAKLPVNPATHIGNVGGF